MIGASAMKQPSPKRYSGSKSKAARVDRSLRRRELMYKLLDAHPESAEELAARVGRASKSAPLIEARVPRAIRKAEKTAEDRIHASIRKGEIVRDEQDRGEPIDPGTGLTFLKRRKRPLQKLADEGKITQDELDAAKEISTAYLALTRGVSIRGASLDRIDGGRGSHLMDMPKHVQIALDHYGVWAGVWTQRNNDYGDPTQEIVIDAVIDEMYLSAIHDKHGYRLAKIENALVGGLRDYAARAGFVTGHQASQWMNEAEAVFGPQAPELRKAVRRAAVER